MHRYSGEAGAGGELLWSVLSAITPPMLVRMAAGTSSEAVLVEALVAAPTLAVAPVVGPPPVTLSTSVSCTVYVDSSGCMRRGLQLG